MFQFMLIAALCTGLSFASIACDDYKPTPVHQGPSSSTPTGPERVLSQQGFRDIHLTGYRLFSGTEDPYNTGFEATSPSGDHVTGIVTWGMVKPYTVRLD